MVILIFIFKIGVIVNYQADSNYLNVLGIRNLFASVGVVLLSRSQHIFPKLENKYVLPLINIK